MSRVINPSESTSWRDALALYASRRIICQLLLGWSGGLPFVLVTSTLGVWLADDGLSTEVITGITAVALPYSIKFLWAPLVDIFRIPLLSQAFGQRRAWLMLTQLLLFAALAAFVGIHPEDGIVQLSMLALLVATLSATQDIVIDAFRVESLPVTEQGAGAAAYVLGYRLAMLFGGAGALVLSSHFEAMGGAAEENSWRTTFIIMSGAQLVGLLGSLLGRNLDASSDRAPEFGRGASSSAADAAVVGAGAPAAGVAAELGAESVVSADSSQEQKFGSGPSAAEAATADAKDAPIGFAETFRLAVVEPFRAFTLRRAWPMLLLLVVLYKLSDQVGNAPRSKFLLDLGFSKVQLAAVVQTWGFFAVILGGILGGALVKKLGLARSMLIGAVVMALSNLMFAAQAWVGPNQTFLALAMAVEQLTGGFGTAAFTTYLGMLCDRRHSATQYALLSALSTVGRTGIGALSGTVAAATGWAPFFILSAVVGLPAIFLFEALRRRGLWGGETEPEKA